MDITVMTANLRLNVQEDGANAWPHRILSVVDVFQTYLPDVIGTQEGLLPMLQDLEPHLKEYAFIGEGREGNQAGEYCAIWYRTDRLIIHDRGQFWLSDTPSVPSTSWQSACPRICTWAVFHAADNPVQRFALFNTHLDHVSQSARQHGIALIEQRMQSIRESTGIPIILTGDMNSEPDNPVIQRLRDSKTLNDVYGANGGLVEQSDLTDEPGPATATFHGFLGLDFTGEENGGPLTNVSGPIDYIFVSPDVTVKRVMIDRKRHMGRFPSDHYPVVAQLTL